jgi:hypothetical protein
MDEYETLIFGQDCLILFQKKPDLDSIEEIRNILNTLTDQIIKEHFLTLKERVK